MPFVLDAPNDEGPRAWIDARAIIVVVVVAPLGRVSRSGIGVLSGGRGRTRMTMAMICKRRKKIRERQRPLRLRWLWEARNLRMMKPELCRERQRHSDVNAKRLVAPPLARRRPILLARGGMRLGSRHLVAMLTTTTTTTTTTTV
jgi:hypothetical protein